MGFGPVTITNAGRQAINTILTVGGTLNFVKITGGSGFPNPTDVPAQFTALKAYVMDASPTSANNSVLYQSTYKANYSSANAPYTFQLNEQGVYYSLNGAAPFLFGYLTTGSASGDTITPSSPSEAVVKDYIIPIVYSQDVPVGTAVTLTPSVDLHAPRHQSTGVDPIPNSSSVVNGLCPVTPGDATTVLRGGATASWGAVPGHFPTHLDNGSDTIPTATLNRTGLLFKLSGDATTVLTGTGTWGAGRVPGEVIDYAGSTPPAGWLNCDGQAYATAAYPNLFGVIGYTYGGSGAVFNVPDCRGRTTVGAGQGSGLTNRALTAKGGEESHTLSTAEMPSHSHGVNDGGHSHALTDPGHAHSVYDPSHIHGVGDPGHAHSVADPTHAHSYAVPTNFSTGPFDYNVNYNNPTGGVHQDPVQRYGTSFNPTNIGIYAARTGVYLGYAVTGIGIYAAATGISLHTAGTGISIQAAGGNSPANVMQPFIAFNKIIRT